MSMGKTWDDEHDDENGGGYLTLQEIKTQVAREDDLYAYNIDEYERYEITSALHDLEKEIDNIVRTVLEWLE